MSTVISADEYQELLASEKRHKYGAVRTEVDGIEFDSKHEAERYRELRTMESAGIIRDLELQPRYPIVVNGEKVCDYVGDFRYWDKETEAIVVEDAKSTATKTPVYRLKKKLVLAVHGVEVVEV